jgi:two-component system, response regulator YesN
MIKLLIVDDEQVEREGMQAILELEFPELVIEQAKNGQMAIELTNEFEPDLILMDIKMPGMNGLEAVEHISAEHPMIQFIMVTAYDTTDYLRQAIKLGVKDYLLKPSKASEITETVGKVIRKIETERKSLEKNKLQQQKTLALVETDIVTQLLFDHVHDVHVDMLIDMLEIPSKSEVFVMLVVLPEGSEDDYTAVKELVRETKSGWVGALYGNQLPIIIFRDKSESFRAQATKLARDLLSLSKTTSESNWFVGIGNVYSELEEIRNSYQHALRAVMDTSLPVKYQFYSDELMMESICKEQLTKQKQKALADYIRLGQWNQIRLYIMNIIECYENDGTDLIYTQQRVLEVLWVASRVIDEMGIEIGSPFYSSQLIDYRQLRTETDRLLETMRETFEDHYHRLEADTIHQLKQYIFDNSQQDISLDALGKLVGLSPIYISKMFKEKLGVNYIDFLTECRMEKAKKLLADSKKSIKEITFEVGYHDPNYFSKVFKKMCKVSPMGYRKSRLGK